jgi:type IV secretory pathway TraG/TraD family ATPase VirD4
MVVDEAGNMPKIEDLRGMVTIGLGRNIFFDFYIQSLQQFESVYGKDGEIIYGNCGNKVYLMAGDDDTPRHRKDFVNPEILFQSDPCTDIQSCLYQQ